MGPVRGAGAVLVRTGAASRVHRAVAAAAKPRENGATGPLPTAPPPMNLRHLFAALFLGAAALMGSFAAHAQVPAATAEQLMRQSGLWQQLAAMAPQVRAGMAASTAQMGAKISEAEAARVSRAIDAAYADDRLRSAALSVITQELDARRVSRLTRWYASKLGQQIARLEERAATDVTEPGITLRDGSAALKAAPADRRAVIAELVTSTRSAEILYEITVEVSIAGLNGIASVQPEAAGLSVGQIRATLEAQRPQMLQTFTELAQASFATTYAVLPLNDLRSYLRFLQSDAGRHFNAVGARAFSAAMVQGSTEFGRRLPGTKDQSNT